MPDAKIITYGEPFSATTDVIPDNQAVALAVQSSDGNDVLTVDTRDGAEVTQLSAAGAAGLEVHVASGNAEVRLADEVGFISDPDLMMRRYGTNTIEFRAAGTDILRIGTTGLLVENGDVGIGASAAGYWTKADDLVINRGVDTDAGITIVAEPSGGSPAGTISFANGTSGNGLYQNIIQATGSGSTDGIRLITNATSTECMRLTTGGDILCPQLDASSDVQTDGSKNLTTSSDMRLKNPISELDAGLDKINQLLPRFFSWKNDEENKSQLGFFSQEVHEVCPEAAPKSPKMVIPESGVGSDGTNACDKEMTQALDADGNPDFNWSLNSRAIVALLVRSVQELSAKVTALESAQGN